MEESETSCHSWPSSSSPLRDNLQCFFSLFQMKTEPIIVPFTALISMINEFPSRFKLTFCIVSHFQTLPSFLLNQLASCVFLLFLLHHSFVNNGPVRYCSWRGPITVEESDCLMRERRGKREGLTSPSWEKEWNGSHSVYSREKERRDSSLFVTFTVRSMGEQAVFHSRMSMERRA